MKKLFIASLTLLSFYLIAQSGSVGINTTLPKSSLDVNGIFGSDGKSLTTDITGLQAPRITLQELTTKGDNLYGTDQKGALVYITDVSSGNIQSQRVNITSVGYYYFDGALWLKLNTQDSNTNIYNSDGSITGLSNPGDLRTLNLNGYSMVFTGEREQTYWSPTGTMSQINNQENGGLASFLLYGGGESLLSLQQFNGSNSQIFSSNGSTGLVIGTNGTKNSAPIVFATSPGDSDSGTERATITGEGRMGVAMMDPKATLHIVKTAYDLTPAIIEGCNEYASNAAAASAGVPIGGLYRTGDFLKIRH